MHGTLKKLKIKSCTQGTALGDEQSSQPHQERSRRRARQRGAREARHEIRAVHPFVR
jgi:hypothetical protein